MLSGIDLFLLYGGGDDVEFIFAPGNRELSETSGLKACLGTTPRHTENTTSQ